MEAANQRRYRRAYMVEKETKEQQEHLEHQPLDKRTIRKLLTERRNVIGPNDEIIRIPKHMSADDIMRIMQEEYNLAPAEILGILVTLKHLANNPEFCGKVNRVVASGIYEPLKIERNTTSEKENVSETKPFVEKTKVETLYEDRTEPKQSNIVYLVNEEEYRRRTAQINAATAERYRVEAEQQRREEAARAAQSANLQKQLDAHYAEQQEYKRSMRNIGLKVACLFGALYCIGALGNLISSFKEITTPDASLKPLAIHEKADPNKLFNATPEMIAAFSNNVTPLVNYEQTPTFTNLTHVDDGYKYESFVVPEPTIANSSEGLSRNSKLYQTMQQYSKNATTPVVIGNISSYEQFEELLKNGGEDLYTSGPAYFANFSRQFLHSMIKDRYNAEKISATYEKKGENDQIYEFYIRYKKNSVQTEYSMEGRVDMTRNEEGRLETSERHTWPIEVYELLAMVGEFSDFSNVTQMEAFDINGYAAKFTNGDVELARQELKERMQYGTECMHKLLKDRVRDDKVSAALDPEIEL